MEDTVIALQKENVQPKTVTAKEKLYFVRLNYSEKVQHMIFLICFVVLVITGFMLKQCEEILRICTLLTGVNCLASHWPVW